MLTALYGNSLYLADIPSHTAGIARLSVDWLIPHRSALAEMIPWLGSPVCSAKRGLQIKLYQNVLFCLLFKSLTSNQNIYFRIHIEKCVKNLRIRLGYCHSNKALIIIFFPSIAECLYYCNILHMNTASLQFNALTLSPYFLS